jgi:hypothetical protein
MTLGSLPVLLSPDLGHNRPYEHLRSYPAALLIVLLRMSTRLGPKVAHHSAGCALLSGCRRQRPDSPPPERAEQNMATRS